METLFYNVGPIFMSVLTFVLMILIGWAIYNFIPVIKKQTHLYNKVKGKIAHLKSIGLFALILGILDQLINLYTIISDIEQAADINANLVLDAIKTSMIPMLYGIFIYLFSLIIWVVFDLILNAKMVDQN